MPRKSKEPVPIRLGHCGLTNPPEIHLQCRGQWNGHPCSCPHHGDPHYFDEPETRVQEPTMPEDLPIPDRALVTIPAERYHAHPALSSSGARKLLPPSCPAKFRYERDHGQPHKDEFDFGHAAHKFVLGDGAALHVVEYDSWRTGDAQQQKKDAYAASKIPLLEKDVATVKAMAAALREHPVASALLDPEHGTPEQSLFWVDKETGIRRRARLDWLAEPTGGRAIFTDYKSTRSADLEAISKSVASFGYNMQAPWYLDGARALGLADDDAVFVFIFQEKEPPYLVTVGHLDATALKIGTARNREAIEIYARCVETDTWPGYAEQPVVVSLPPYVENRAIQEYAL